MSRYSKDNKEYIEVHVLPPGYNYSGIITRPSDLVLYDKSKQKESEYKQTMKDIEDIKKKIKSLTNELAKLDKKRRIYEGIQ